MQNLLTTNEVAERLGVKPTLLRTWRKRGQGPKFTKYGVQAMYRVRDIEVWERRMAREGRSA
jgi:DNA-binding transcriptional MerR regulator